MHCLGVQYIPVQFVCIVWSPYHRPFISTWNVESTAAPPPMSAVYPIPSKVLPHNLKWSKYKPRPEGPYCCTRMLQPSAGFFLKRQFLVPLKEESWYCVCFLNGLCFRLSLCCLLYKGNKIYTHYIFSFKIQLLNSFVNNSRKHFFIISFLLWANVNKIIGSMTKQNMKTCPYRNKLPVLKLQTLSWRESSELVHPCRYLCMLLTHFSNWTGCVLCSHIHILYIGLEIGTHNILSLSLSLKVQLSNILVNNSTLHYFLCFPFWPIGK